MRAVASHSFESSAIPEKRATGGREALFAFGVTVWLGILIGVSFMATPIKFSAPSLNLPTALDVGRVTFALLSKTEWVLCAILVIVTALEWRSRPLRLACCLALALLVAGQSIWLLPALDARIDLIIQGGVPAPAAYHQIYIVCEVVKAVLLLWLSSVSLWRMASYRGAP